MPVGSPGAAPAQFFLANGVQQGNHVRIAVHMFAFVEGMQPCRGIARLGAFTVHIAQVQKVNPLAKPSHHAWKIIVAARAQGTGAKGDAV